MNEWNQAFFFENGSLFTKNTKKVMKKCWNTEQILSKKPNLTGHSWWAVRPEAGKKVLVSSTFKMKKTKKHKIIPAGVPASEETRLVCLRE